VTASKLLALVGVREPWREDAARRGLGAQRFHEGDPQH